MKFINGWPCRRVKTQMGRKYWVRMSEDEILAREYYRLAVVTVPLVMLFLFAWAAGVLK